MRIAVIGASGLVGSTLVERLLHWPDCEVVPFIHDSGNAWRLVRLGVAVRQLDLLDANGVARSLAGCTHVVNCSRGDEEVMLRGLTHLLAASRATTVERFIHLSSVIVYGDPPHPGSVREDAPCQAARGSYAWIKLKQDKLVAAAARRGLSSTVLCLPNVSGPYSYYLLQILAALASRSLAVVAEGQAPCVLVDVENVSHAIERSLTSPASLGARVFVTDDEPLSWAHVIHELSTLLPPGTVDQLPRVSRETLQRMLASAGATPISLLNAATHVVSSDVRAAMRQDPLWAQLERHLLRCIRWFGSAVEDRLRLFVDGPIPINKAQRTSAFNLQLSAHQLRGVVHSSDRARALLGYRPLHTTLESIAAFRAWYREHQGMNSEYAELLVRLAESGR